MAVVLGQLFIERHLVFCGWLAFHQSCDGTDHNKSSCREDGALSPCRVRFISSVRQNCTCSTMRIEPGGRQTFGIMQHLESVGGLLWASVDEDVQKYVVFCVLLGHWRG